MTGEKQSQLQSLDWSLTKTCTVNCLLGKKTGAIWGIYTSAPGPSGIGNSTTSPLQIFIGIGICIGWYSVQMNILSSQARISFHHKLKYDANFFMPKSSNEIALEAGSTVLTSALRDNFWVLQLATFFCRVHYYPATAGSSMLCLSLTGTKSGYNWFACKNVRLFFECLIIWFFWCIDCFYLCK